MTVAATTVCPDPAAVRATYGVVARNLTGMVATRVPAVNRSEKNWLRMAAGLCIHSPCSLTLENSRAPVTVQQHLHDPEAEQTA